ncbi:MAG: ABC transporter ATP-binding protein [Candidatus Zixiibacteriota bacterium]|nr:MAG: ABC transporter ATP-binding protein [candidate division Zixibacteria bacterium]
MLIKYIKWFWRFYRRHKRALLLLVTFPFLTSALFVIQPLLLKNIFDLLQSGNVQPTSLQFLSNFIATLGAGKIINYALMMIIFGMASFALHSTLVGHRAYMNLKLEWESRQHTFSDVTTKGPDFFNRFSTGDLVTRMTDDITEKISWFACSGIFRFYEALTLIMFSLIMMLAIHPGLTLWTAGPLPILILIYMRSSTLLDRRFDFLQKRITDVNDSMEACFSGIRVIKAYNRENDQKKKFAEVAKNRLKAEILAVKTHTVIESLWMYIWQLGIVIVLLAGGYYVIRGSLSIGEFVAFDSYVIYLIYPMFDVGNFLVKGLRAGVSVKRLMELEDHQPMIVGGDNGQELSNSPRARVEFDKVFFRFDGMERDILADVSFAAEPGQRIALVGKVGAGKSWAARLVPRLVDPTGGRVMLDGVDLRQYDLGELRRNIGYVPQEPILFSETIENNIRFNRDGITDDILNWAIDVSQFREEVEAFPKGLKTRIGVRGVSISGGQKQRLALARALVGKPRVLILDDCTSALDAKTEAALWDRLYEVMPDLTCFIVTHRPATLEQSNEVIVLDEGRIVESGNHIDLILQEGLYCRLYHRIMLEEAVGAPSA